MNLLTATTARVNEQEDSSDVDSMSDTDRYNNHVGSLELVHDTLKGIAARDEDEGLASVGRHASSINMGRQMWETPELTSEEKARARES